MKSTISTNVALSGDHLESFPISIAKDGHGKIAALCRRGLYREPYYIAFMETVANAVDSHIQFGVGRPVEVSLDPCTYNVSIRDFGPGVSREEAKKHLFSYGSSTRNADNLCVGGFGIGAKAPLCAVERMTVISRNGGVKTVYECFDDGLGGKVHVESEEPTEEPSGLEVVYNIMDSFVKRDTEGNKVGEYLSDSEKHQFLMTLSMWVQTIGLGRDEGRQVLLKSWAFEMAPNPFKNRLHLIPKLQEIRDKMAEDGWYMPRLEIDMIPVCLLPESMVEGTLYAFKDSDGLHGVLVSNGVHLYKVSGQPKAGSELSLVQSGLWAGSPIIKVLDVNQIKVTADRESGVLLQQLTDPRDQCMRFPLLAGVSGKFIESWLKTVKGSPLEKLCKLQVMTPIVKAFVTVLNSGRVNSFLFSERPQLPYSERMQMTRGFSIHGGETRVKACPHAIQLFLMVWEKEYPKCDGFYDHNSTAIAERVMNNLEPEWVEFMKALRIVYRLNVFVTSKKAFQNMLEYRDPVKNEKILSGVSLELLDPLFAKLESDTKKEHERDGELYFSYYKTGPDSVEETYDLVENLREYIRKHDDKGADWSFSASNIRRAISKLRVSTKTGIQALKDEGKIVVITYDDWDRIPDLIGMLAFCIQEGKKLKFNSFVLVEGSGSDLNHVLLSKELTNKQIMSVTTVFEKFCKSQLSTFTSDWIKAIRQRFNRDKYDEHLKSLLELRNDSLYHIGIVSDGQNRLFYGLVSTTLKNRSRSISKFVYEELAKEIGKKPEVCRDYLKLFSWVTDVSGNLVPPYRYMNSISYERTFPNDREKFKQAKNRMLKLVLSILNKAEKTFRK